MYGKLSSTWPVHSGVIVEDGVAYAAAGIIDYDGTYVYALDATTGSIKWQNNTSGHLDADLRKGVSAHGDLTIASGRLWMPGGNVVSPAAYDLETGEYRGSAVGDGSPKTNRGEEIGIFRGNHVVLGGRLRFSPVKNVVNPGSFSAQSIGSGNTLGDTVSLHQGKIPPAWDEQHVAMVDGRLSVPVCYDAGDFENYLNGGDKPKPKWIGTAVQGSDVVGLTVTPNAILAVCEMPRQRRIATRWMVCALDIDDGSLMFERSLPGAALPGGLTVDRDGRVIVVMADGRVASFGDEQIFQANIALLTEQAPEDPAARQAAIRLLTRTLKTPQGRKLHAMALAKLAKLGAEIDSETRQAGGISRWQLLGPVPWNDENDIDKIFVGEPNVDVAGHVTIDGRTLQWSDSITDDRYGMVDLAARYGRLANVAMYAHAEFELPKAQDLLLKIGSNDGFKCWLNGEPVGRFVGPRGYRPDQDTLKVRGIAGRNRVLLKITQLGSNWAFGVRVTDRQGRPIAINYGAK